MKVKGLLLLLFILLMLVIAGFVGSQNSHLVSINYILAETEMRMSVLLAVTFLLGIIFSVLLIIGYILRLKWRIGSLERKNKKLSLPTNAT
ncbi:LapA family protein [uncultured Paraglaciecola sp.]|uniref:LapA family protein n=1 Tax=uncultured Paraglaciecola sp. TaxID=1765024 RepID=UPI0030DCF831|tara:strand:- start:13932 stop:14204 length:273 start_codon:yes stop_codon:yes gene_type:complete